MCTKVKLLGLLTGLIFALSASMAHAVLLWEAAPIDYGTEIRPANSNFITRFTLTNDIFLTNIAQETDLQGNGSMNFVVFNSTNGDLLFETGAAAFIDDGFNFNISPDFGYQLFAGNTYAIGAVANVSAVYGRNLDNPVTSNGITSLSGNQNIFNGFISPTLDLVVYCCDARVQLYGNVGRGPEQVPEPTTLALLSLGLAGLGFTRRKLKA